ncbi:MAG: hypothetical protein L6265_11630 [Thermoplasmatales archaeon]|nr:hypothetical protein [Thermoplasmatales archaeon]
MGKERKKEIDLLVREKLMREISKSREYMKNVLEGAYKNNDAVLSDAVKRVMDELDVFSNEAELSEVGHKYPMFSVQQSASGWDIKRLTKYDRSIVEKAEIVTEASKRLENAIIEKEEDIDPVKELGKIRQYVTDARNEYKNRADKLKGVK